MKTQKLIFAGIIALLFGLAMWIYKDTISLLEVISAFVGAGGVIKIIWNWLNTTEKLKIADQKIKAIEEENNALRVMHKAELRKNNLKTNTMTDQEAEVISAQLHYVNNLLGATHPAKTVHVQTIENFVSVIGGGGIVNQPPN